MLFDIESSDEDVEKSILKGKYRLQPYAVMLWSKMVNDLVTFEETLDKYAGTAKLLDKLNSTRRNSAFNPPIDTNADSSPDWITQSRWSHAYKLLQKTLQFRQDNDWGDWNFDNG